jgi:DNA-binding IclR family transcriptional regulator
MGDVQDLFRRATEWMNDAAELDKLMADMSASQKAQVHDVHHAARILLHNARSGFNNGLSEYQSALCHVYMARGEGVERHRQAFNSIQQAGGHFETLREAFKPLTALGIPEHPMIEELSEKIAELRR